MSIICIERIILTRSCCSITTEVIRQSYLISTNCKSYFFSYFCCLRSIRADGSIRCIHFCGSEFHICFSCLLCLKVQSKRIANLFIFTITSYSYRASFFIIGHSVSCNLCCFQSQFLFVIVENYIHCIVNIHIIRINLYFYRCSLPHFKLRRRCLKIYFIRSFSNRINADADRITNCYIVNLCHVGIHSGYFLYSERDIFC